MCTIKIKSIIMRMCIVHLCIILSYNIIPLIPILPTSECLKHDTHLCIDMYSNVIETGTGEGDNNKRVGTYMTS